MNLLFEVKEINVGMLVYAGDDNSSSDMPFVVV